MPELDNAAAAPAPGGDNTPPAPAPDPNDPNTEMSAEDEAAFVDRQLGITDSGAPFAVAPNDGKGDDANKDDKKAEPKPGDSTETPGTGTPEPGSDEQPPAGGAEKPTDEEPETPAAEEVEQTPQAPQEVDTTDLWVELTDANGKEFKIGVNDPIPEDLVFKNDAQLAELTEARMEMKSTLRERQAEYDKATADAEANANSAKTEEQQLAAWDTEIQDLIGAGLIEAPKAKPGDKDFLQDASVQKIDAVFKFMGAQNAERAKTNKPPITSFGTAYTLWSNDRAQKDAEEAQNKSNETAKARGSLVGGSSSSSSGGGNQNLYTQGSAGSIHDLDFSDIE